MPDNSGKKPEVAAEHRESMPRQQQEMAQEHGSGRLVLERDSLTNALRAPLEKGETRANVSLVSVPDMVQGVETEMKEEAGKVMQEDSLDRDMTHAQVKAESLEGTKLLLLTNLFRELGQYRVVRVDGLDLKQIGNALSAEEFSQGEAFMVCRSNEDFVKGKVNAFLQRLDSSGEGGIKPRMTGVGGVDALKNKDLGFTLEHCLHEEETGKEINIKLYFIFGKEEQESATGSGEEESEDGQEEYAMAA